MRSGKNVNIKKDIVKLIVLYVLLISFIVLPFIKHYPSFIAGGDFNFVDYGSNILFQRIFYYWQESDGFGGLSIGRYGSIAILFIISVIKTFISLYFLQILLILAYYSIAFWGVYLLLKEYGKKFNIKFTPVYGGMLAMFYCTNLFAYNFLKIPTYLFLSYFAFTPLIIYLFIKNLQEKNLKKYFLLFLVSTIFNTYTYTNVTNGIIQFVTIILFLIPFVRISQYKKILTIFGIFFLINSPSLIEYYLYFLNSNTVQIAQGQVGLIDSAKKVQSSLFNLRYILNFLSGDIFGKWWNSKGEVSNFQFAKIYQDIFYNFILFIPIFILTINLFSHKKNKIKLFFLSIFCLSIVLISMYGFSPLNGFWNKMYEFPAVGIFRNSSKFWVPLILSSSIILMLALSRKKILINIFCVYLLFLNVNSFAGLLFNNDIFINLPKEYETNSINNALSSITKSDSVGIVYPAKNFFLYGFNWGYVGYSPFLLLQNKISLLHKGSESLSIANLKLYNKFKDENIVNLSKDDFVKNNINYVILHKDVNYGTFNYTDNYTEVTNFLKANFNKIFENENYIIFNTSKTSSVISSSGVYFQKVNPTKYKIFFKSLKNKQEISFLKSYHPAWEIFVNKYPNMSWCKKFDKVGDKNFECQEENNFFQGDELSYFWEKPYFPEGHFMESNYSNGWSVDPEYIKQNFPKEDYIENADGSISVEFTLFFKPQSYFYLGLIISGFTIISCLGYLIYSGRKEIGDFWSRIKRVGSKAKGKIKGNKEKESQNETK